MSLIELHSSPKEQGLNKCFAKIYATAWSPLTQNNYQSMLCITKEEEKLRSKSECDKLYI